MRIERVSDGPGWDCFVFLDMLSFPDRVENALLSQEHGVLRCVDMKFGVERVSTRQNLLEIPSFISLWFHFTHSYRLGVYSFLFLVYMLLRPEALRPFLSPIFPSRVEIYMRRRHI